MLPDTHTDQLELIRLNTVIRLTGLSRSGIYQKISNGEFSQQVNIGTRAVAWIASEVHDWIRDQIMASRK